MRVLWTAKRGKEHFIADDKINVFHKTLHKRYTRLTDALYKMYRLEHLGYGGVHIDFEPGEEWLYGDRVLSGEGWDLYWNDKVWDDTIKDYRKVDIRWELINENNHTSIDITRDFERFKKRSESRKAA